MLFLEHFGRGITVGASYLKKNKKKIEKRNITANSLKTPVAHYNAHHEWKHCGQ